MNSGVGTCCGASWWHVTEFGFGILAAIPFIAAFAQLPASFLVERYGHRKRVFLGLPMTYHCILFLMSMFFRFFALLCLRGIEDPRAFTARQAISYMAADMHSNIQNALMVPVRLWSYKVRMKGE